VFYSVREIVKLPVLVFTIIILMAGDLLAYDGGKIPESIKTPVSTRSVIRDINLLNTSDIHICYENRGSAQVVINFENLGNDTLYNIQFGWFITVDDTGSQQWSGVLPPNSNQFVTLNQLTFTNSGTHNIKLWADIGLSDINSSNDSASLLLVVEPFLALDVLSDTSICANTSFSLEIPVGYASYTWGNGQNVRQVIAENSGLYKVTVTNALGCQAVDSMVIDQYPSPTSLLPPDTVLCDSTILVPQVSEKFSSYNWGFGDTVSNISISVEGSYVLSVIDTFGCAYTDTLNVQYAAPPIPTIPTQVFICDGDSAILSVSALFSSFQWSNGSTASSISTTSPGVYYITVTGTSGCFGYDTVQVLVNSLPDVVFNDSIMCNLEPFILDVGWYSSFQWSNGDTIQHPVITSPGWYGVSITDLNGCENSDSIEVVNVNVSVSLGPDTSICEGDGSFIILGQYDYYLWDDGHNGPSQFIGKPGIYSVTVTTTGCSISDDLLVVELPYPLASFTETIASNTVDFINGSNTNSNIDWSFGDGHFSSQVNPTHTFSAFGMFDVTLTTSNICGIDSLTKTIGVFPLAVNSIYKEDDFIVYPSLVSDVVHIKLGLSNLEILTYRVYDASGKLLLVNEERVLGGDQVFNLNVSNFATGSYFLRVSGDQEFIGVKQFFKH
jgi:hypothetical protein